MKRILAILITLIYACGLLICTPLVHAEETDSYEWVELPVISDKLKDNEIAYIPMFKEKEESDVLYIELNTVCDLIGATWYVRDGGFGVNRDCTYFRYYDAENMKLIISPVNNAKKWDIQDNVLLEGVLFSCKRIGEVWYVDFIEFCEMFGVSFFKITETTIQQIKDNIKSAFGENAAVSLDKIDIEDDLDFINHPYYIYLHSGITLSSIYREIWAYEDLYIWDYSCYKDSRGESDSWLNEIQIGGTYITFQSANIVSNFLNDDYGFTKLLYSEYQSDEHYKKVLLDTIGVQYSRYLSVENLANGNESLSEQLKRLLNYNTIISSTMSVMDYSDYILEKYLDASLPEIEGFDGISKCLSLLGSPVQAYMEACSFHDKLDNLAEERIQLLNKSIIENDSLDNNYKIQQQINYALDYIGGTSVTVLLNSIDNYTGLVDSSEEICSLYKNGKEQFNDALEKGIESGLYAVSDDIVQTVLSESGDPKLMAIGALLSVYDVLRTWTQDWIGDSLQGYENVVQYYFIERTMQKNLDLKNPENLYNRLMLMLEASLCCFEFDEENFAMQKNSISKMLYKLDNCDNLNIYYYRDPRDNNIDDDVKNAILNYSDRLIVPVEDETDSTEIVEIPEVEPFSYTWHVEPTIEADFVGVLNQGHPTLDYHSEEYYKFNTNWYSEYCGFSQDGLFGIIDYDGNIIASAIYDEISVKSGRKCILTDESFKHVKLLSDGSISDAFEEYYEVTNGYPWACWIESDKKVYCVEGGSSVAELPSATMAVCIGFKKDNGDGWQQITTHDWQNPEYVLIVDGKKVSDTVYENAGCFFDGIIPVKKDGKWGYVNENGDTVIPFEYDDAWASERTTYHSNDNRNVRNRAFDASDGYVVLCQNGQYALYTTTGGCAIPFGELEEISPVYEGMAWAKKDGKWGVIQLGEAGEKTESSAEASKSQITAIDLIDKTIPEIIDIMGGEYQVIKTENDGYIYIQNQSALPGMEFYVLVPYYDYDTSLYVQNGEELHDDNLRSLLESGEYQLDGIQVNGTGSAESNINADMDYIECSEYLGGFECTAGTGGYLGGSVQAGAYTYTLDNADITLYFDVDSDLVNALSMGEIRSISSEQMKSLNPSLMNVVIHKDMKTDIFSWSKDEIVKAVNTYLQENWCGENQYYCFTSDLFENDSNWSVCIRWDGSNSANVITGSNCTIDKATGEVEISFLNDPYEWFNIWDYQ